MMTPSKQKGFTLIEVLVTLVITGIIIGAVGGIVSQIFRINALDRDSNVALRQVQNAGTWMSRDALQATSIGLPNANVGFPITITENLSTFSGDITVIVYDINVNHELTRSVSVNGSPVSQTIIAYGVSIDPLNYDPSTPTWFRLSEGNRYQLKITSLIGSQTVTRYYDIERRPQN